jgi:hypothetical protein
VNLVETLIVVIGVAVCIIWYFHKLMRVFIRQIEFRSPLREVIKVGIELQNMFFTEALKLSDEEISGNSDIVHGIQLHLRIWKAHYSGDISFYRKLGEEPLKSVKIQEFPTVRYQFPISLAEHSLFGLPDQNRLFDFGPNGTEKLEVLLSHKAIIVRARDGDLWRSASSTERPSEIVIPIREQDLTEYVDTFGNDDPDWFRATGLQRRYQRRGRWAWWNMSAVYPQSLSWTTSFLDKSAIKPND